MSDPTTHKALVAEFIDAVFTRGELEAVDRYLAPGFVNHDPFPGFAPDREGLRQTAQVFRQAFPDWHAGQEAHIAEGDLVAERFTARGTHQGEIMGVAPTGREVTLAGINIFRVQDGKVVERWGRTDDLGFLQQLDRLSSVTDQPRRLTGRWIWLDGRWRLSWRWPAIEQRGSRACQTSLAALRHNENVTDSKPRPSWPSCSLPASPDPGGSPASSASPPGP